MKLNTQNRVTITHSLLNKAQMIIYELIRITIMVFLEALNLGVYGTWHRASTVTFVLLGH